MDSALFHQVYQSVVNRETTYDGIYYTGVRTTKIVCRPSCRARTPKPENVTFYRSLNDALEAGFRPCKRCKPDSPGLLNPDHTLVQTVNDYIERNYDQSITLPILATELSISPFHLQRVYKKVMGISPAEKLKLVRLKHTINFLTESSYTTTEISRMVGFQSPSHFSVWFKEETGLTPTLFREQKLREKMK